MTASAPMASSVSAVSLRDSPLETEEPRDWKLMTSALRRLGGGLKRDAGSRRILKEEVDDSLALKRRKLLHAVALSGGHLLRCVEDQNRLLARQVTDRNEMAQAHRLQAFPEKDAIAPVCFVEQNGDDFVAGGRQVLADVVRANRKLAVATVDEDCELNGRRATDTSKSIERA